MKKPISKVERVIIAIFCILGCLGCATTPEGKRAKSDAVVIQKNAAVAQKATRDAKDDNANIQTHATSVQSLDQRADAKDAVIESWFKQHQKQ